MNKKYFILLSFMSCIITTGLFARDRMAILPIHSIGLDKNSVQTAENIMVQEISILTKDQLVPKTEVIAALDGDECADIGCAMDVGDRVAADLVVMCSMSALGDKIIIQYMLLDVEKSRTIIGDNVTAETVESLDVIMKRIAASIISRQSMSESARVGSVIENEEAANYRRREARSFNGLSFGYLYPSKGYDQKARSLTLEYRKGYDMNDFFVGMQLATREGIAANIFMNYLTSKEDFCPYLGGGLGFHWVAHPVNDELRNDGFELLLTTGVRAFRTYNFQVLMNLDYTKTFNDYNDEGIIFTIGLLW
ncbi:MAG: hypothetical protein ACE5D7_08880 [Fidelibacterota bacterium]